MLNFTRKQGQRVIIQVGSVEVAIEVLEARGRVKLGFDAPPEVAIDREEILEPEGHAETS